jgi:hypothetical protein
VINIIGLDANAKINILDAKGQMLLTDSGIPSDLITIGKKRIKIKEEEKK